MKKIFTFILALTMILGLVGCSNPTEEEASTQQPTEAPVVTPEPTAEPTPEPIPAGWEMDFAVDDFGDPTDSAYARGIFTGSFSNTATTDADLGVVIFFTPACATENWVSTFAFRLLEYEDVIATYSSDENIVLKIKIGDEIFEDELFGTPPNGDLLLTNQSDVYSTLLDALVANEQDIRCIIEMSGSKYSFTINGNDYAKTADEILVHYGYAPQFGTN